MTATPETLSRAVHRLRQLSFAEAYERIVAQDPLGLATRATEALEAAGRWSPPEAVVLRAARHLAAGLRVAPARLESADEADEPALDGWVSGHIRQAVSESTDALRASEPREQDAWARHVRRVAATLGVDDRLALDALALFHAHPEDTRRFVLRGLRLVREGRTRELDAAEWAQFDLTWRALVRAVLTEPRP